MTLKFMGKKAGMTQIFDESGNAIVCTVISAEPNVISQIKDSETDGYKAVQLSAIKLNAAKTRNLSKAMKGHFAKGSVEPRRHVLETRVENPSDYSVGQEVTVGQFADVEYVDVCGVSKGKGFQGVIKRHNFAGGPAAHGSGFHRHGGSTGMRTSPGRCLPGQKKAGRMGGEKVTTQNLKVVKIDEEKNILLVKGAIPGPRNALVIVSRAKKKTRTKKKA